jgi:hypothetical protein
MKADKLEKFIGENRNKFDDLAPDPAIWDKIQKREAGKISLNWTKILVRAAAIVVIFVSSYIFIDYLSNQNKIPMLVEEELIDPKDAGMVQELLEAEYYYTAQIDEKKEVFYCLTADNKGLRDDVNMELIELDQVFKDLKEDLKDNADNEEVVFAMIQNYRLKLEILEEISRQLQSAQENNDCYENESVNM